MLISTNSGYHSARPKKERYTMLEMVDFSCELGFEALDINFSATIYQDPFAHETIFDGDWEKNIMQLKTRAKEKGLRLVQSHLPFYDFSDTDHPDYELREEMTRRSIIACGMLEIPWVVFHPLHKENSEADEQLTREYLDKLIPFADKHKVGIAIENMNRPLEHFSIDGKKLAKLADDYDCGICLDTGHANLTGLDTIEMIYDMGNRIKVLHVQDNKGLKDDHIPPFFGTVDWESTMKALKKAGYQGALNFEVANKAVPEVLRKEYGTYLVTCGKILRNMFEQA